MSSGVDVVESMVKANNSYTPIFSRIKGTKDASLEEIKFV